MPFETRRLSLVGFLTLWSLGAAAAPPAKDPAPTRPTCDGRSQVEALRNTSPERYAAALARTDQVPNAEGLLWRIEKPGQRPSYLFGTIHVSDPRATELTGVVRQKLAQARVVATEIPQVDEPRDPLEAARRMALAAAAPGGDSLDFLTDASARTRVETAALAHGLSREQIAKIQPWYLWMMLGQPDCELKRRKSGLPIVDRVVALERPRGTMVVGLESIDEQVEVLSGRNEAAKRMLAADAARQKQPVDLLETILDAYLQRRIPLFHEVLVELGYYSAEELRDHDEFMEALLDKRNVRMTQRALPYLRQGDAFIAVGSSHLPGRLGMVEMFRQAGYSLTKVW